MNLETHLKANTKEEKHLKDLIEKCTVLMTEVATVNAELDNELSKIRQDTFNKISEVMK